MAAGNHRRKPGRTGEDAAFAAARTRRRGRSLRHNRLDTAGRGGGGRLHDQQPHHPVARGGACRRGARGPRRDGSRPRRDRQGQTDQGRHHAARPRAAPRDPPPQPAARDHHADAADRGDPAGGQDRRRDLRALPGSTGRVGRADRRHHHQPLCAGRVDQHPRRRATFLDCKPVDDPQSLAATAGLRGQPRTVGDRADGRHCAALHGRSRPTCASFCAMPARRR